MRRPIIAGNWKMNTNVAEARALANALVEGLSKIDSADSVLCPPFISLAPLSEILAGTRVGLGAQDMFWEEKGAFTGEVSPTMLKGLCQYVIIGHSERRQYFGETNQTVNRKLKAALAHGLTPIVCVGENLDQREAGQTESFITTQVNEGLADLESLDGVVIAYEPIWAIGTGRAATSDMAEEVCAQIRRTLSAMYGEQAAQATRIQYGGSVTSSNVTELMSKPNIDGGLVGGASLKAEEFLMLIELAAKAKSS